METAVKTDNESAPEYPIAYPPNWERFRNLMFSTSEDYIPVSVRIINGGSKCYEFVITNVDMIEHSDRSRQTWRVKGRGYFDKDPRQAFYVREFTLDYSLRTGFGTITTDAAL
jgi:hypothetical protein